jgi:hypothetical protein
MGVKKILFYSKIRNKCCSLQQNKSAAGEGLAFYQTKDD